MSNNVQSAGENAYGVYAEAYANGTGQATCVPSLTGGTVNSYYDAFYGEAYSDGSSSTQTGNAICNPVITSAKLVSTYEDAIDLYADSDSKGVARTNASVTSTRIESGESYGAYFYSESEYGAAHAAPVFTNCTGAGSYNSDFMDCYAYTYDVGFANASPVWKGGSIRNLFLVAGCLAAAPLLIIGLWVRERRTPVQRQYVDRKSLRGAFAAFLAVQLVFQDLVDQIVFLLVGEDNHRHRLGDQQEQAESGDGERGSHVASPPAVLHGGWQHIAWTRRDDGNSTLWLDGRAVAQQRLIAPRGAVRIRLARLPVRHDLPFRGAIADVRIYDRALSADELAALARR